MSEYLPLRAVQLWLQDRIIRTQKASIFAPRKKKLTTPSRDGIQGINFQRNNNNKSIVIWTAVIVANLVPAVTWPGLVNNTFQIK